MKDLRQLLATSILIYITCIHKFLVKTSSLRNGPSSTQNFLNLKIKHSMNLYFFFFFSFFFVLKIAKFANVSQHLIYSNWG